MRYSYCTLIALAALHATIFAQSETCIEVSGGFVSNQLASGVYSNWKDGWTLAGGVSYPLSSRTDLMFEARYSRLPFEGNNLELAFPAIAGLRWSVSGLPSNIYETSVGIRFQTLGTFMRPFLAVHAGLVVMDVGKVTISQWYDSQPGIVSQSTYLSTGTLVTRASGSLGIGTVIPISETLALVTEGRFIIVFGTEQIFMPLTLIGQFQL